MISVMNNNDLDLDRNPDIIQNEARVSGEGGDVSSDKAVNGDRVSQAVVVDSSDKTIYGGNDEARSVDFDSRVSVGDFNMLGDVESKKIRVLEVDWQGSDEEMKSGAFGIRNEDAVQMANDHKTGDKNNGSEQRLSRVEKGGLNSEEKGFVEFGSRASDHKFDVGNDGSAHSRFDEFVANGKREAVGVGLSTSVGYGYEIGDMIWGKVKSHPWWPGFIYNESFASPSVRRTKREGHVLVAFFGDSSYGWFEPAELVPFDANFSEKSRQTNSRTFVNAVEEAVDEVSRRRGLSLACRCRNPYNFRPTDVQGYFAVDLNDYEPGWVYPVSQIRKARESFEPRETLAFIKQLALMARGDVNTSIDFIKNKATVLAYRKAAFEEFDETYAQAFGQQPVRPSRESLETLTQPVRAPLSGPMVIAEALGKRRKNSTKPNKAKDQENKDRYLFKRRDEPSEVKIHEVGQGTSSTQPPYVAGSLALAVGDYALGKGADGSKVEPPSAFGDSFDNGRGALLGSKEKAGYNAIADPTIMDASGSSDKGRFHGGKDGVARTPKKEGGGTISLKNDRQQPPSLPSIVEGQEQVHSGGHVLPMVDPKFHGQALRMHVDTGTKKDKLLKRPTGELGAEKSASGEKKMKKKKREKELGTETSSDLVNKKKKREKEPGTETSSDLMQKQGAAGKDGPSSATLPDSTGMRQTLSMRNTELKLQQLLGDLQDLALNPYHGMETDNPAIVQKAFLKFRSLVYEKSVPPAEMEESNEVHDAPIPPAGTSVGENIKDLPPPKPLMRPDDPAKGGRKRGPSDRQDELAAKRLKKVNDLKSLAVEKKAASAQKTLETHRDGKETTALRPPKPLQPDSIKKTVSPSKKAREPTMLVMKFPPNASLPSGSELKARLARFGPLDHSATRVFWQSFTCRVVYLHRSHAEAANRYLTSGNNSLFGNVNVRSHIRPMGGTAAESEPVETPVVEHKQQPAALPMQQPAVQLKSCLKKPVGDEVAGMGSNGGGGRRTPRVKFVVEGGESSGGGEQSMGGNKNFNNNASFVADNGASSSSTTTSSSHGMDFNSKNFQKGILPLPPASAKLHNAPNNLPYADAPPRNTHNFSGNVVRAGPIPIPSPSPSPTNDIDIAQQMVGLLMKCNDLVTNVSSFLGYVPYHPL